MVIDDFSSIGASARKLSNLAAAAWNELMEENDKSLARGRIEYLLNEADKLLVGMEADEVADARINVACAALGDREISFAQGADDEFCILGLSRRLQEMTESLLMGAEEDFWVGHSLRIPAMNIRAFATSATKAFAKVIARHFGPGIERNVVAFAINGGGRDNEERMCSALMRGVLGHAHPRIIFSVLKELIVVKIDIEDIAAQNKKRTRSRFYLKTEAADRLSGILGRGVSESCCNGLRDFTLGTESGTRHIGTCERNVSLTKLSLARILEDFGACFPAAGEKIAPSAGM